MFQGRFKQSFEFYPARTAFQPSLPSFGFMAGQERFKKYQLERSSVRGTLDVPAGMLMETSEYVIRLADIQFPVF